MTAIKVMKREEYDADDDGIVDEAASLSDGAVIDGGVIE